MTNQTAPGGVKVAENQDTLRERPDSRLTEHGACGKTWIQRGNRSGHCSGCHATFEGIAAFDAHRRTDDDGQRVCVDPATVKVAGHLLELIGGTWRGPRMSDEEKERRRNG